MIVNATKIATCRSMSLSIFLFIGVIASSCGENLFGPGTSVSSHGEHPYLVSKVSVGPSDKNLSSVVKVQSLALGEEVLTQLESDLNLAGLNQEQIFSISQNAREELKVQVSKIALPDTSFQLTEDTTNQYDPVSIALPFIISGSLKALSLEASGTSDNTGKARFAGIILESSFGSLNGRIDHFSSDGINLLSKTMAGTAVENISSAGFDKSQAAEGGFAIASGAIGALKKSGIDPSQTASIAGSIVSGAVEKLSKLDWGTQGEEATGTLLTGAIAKISEGAVFSLKKASENQSQSVSILSAIVGSTMEGMGSIKNNNPSVTINLQTTINFVSKSVVGRLKDADMAGDQLGNSLSNMTGALVGSLGKSGLKPEELAQGISSVCSGALSGLASTGLNETEIESSGAISSVMEGSISKMASLELNEMDRAGAMSLVVEGAIASIDEAGISNSSVKSSAINSVLSGTVKSFSNAGITSVSVIAVAVKNMTKGATNGLANAGVSEDELDDFSGVIAKGSISLLVENKVNQDSDSFKNLVGEVTKGVMEGMGSLSQSGAIKGTGLQTGLNLVIGKAMEAVAEIQSDASKNQGLQVTDLASLSVKIATGATGGLALSGVAADSISSFQSEMSTIIKADLQTRGVSSEDLNLLDSQISNAVESAKTLADAIKTGGSSYSLCSDSWNDSLSNEDVYQKSKNLPDPVLCRVSKDSACPVSRSHDAMSLDWIISGIPVSLGENESLCEMLRTVKSVIYPGEFSVINPQAAYNTATPSFSWSPSDGAESYLITISTDKTCTSVSNAQYLTSTNKTLPALADGSYYLCLAATNIHQKVTPALNSGLNFTINTSSDTTTSDPAQSDPAPSETVSGSFLINNGATHSNTITVILTFSTTNGTEMYITNEAGCTTGGSWESIPANKAWNLKYYNLPNTVYMKFRSQSLQESECVSANIIQDEQGPEQAGLNINTSQYTNSTVVTLFPYANDAIEMYITNDQGCASGGTWETYSTVRSNWVISQENQSATVYIKFKDVSGNVSECVSDSITHDNIPPSGTGIQFTSNESQTSSTTESLTLTFSDAVDMYVTNASDCGSQGTWETAVASKSWNLNIIDGIAYVYVKYRDHAGNETPCQSASILYTAPPDYVRNAGGFNHLCFINDSGDLRCWGQSDAGQTGGYSSAVGDQAGEMTGLAAINLGTGRKALEVDAGGYHTCALLDNFQVKCWGEGFSGKTGLGTTSAVGVSQGEMGDALAAVNLGSGRTAKRIFLGAHHSCAILDNDTLKCWGNNNNGQLGQEHSSNIGESLSTMGDNLPAINLGTGLHPIQIAGGGYHTCALLNNSKVKCWGQGSYGQLGNESTSSIGKLSNEMGDYLPYVDLGTNRTAKEISAGFYHSCALLDDDTIKCWGKNNGGELGLEHTSKLGYTSGQMGDNLPTVNLGLDQNVKPKSLLSGNYHNCVLLSDSSVKCWGSNSSGQLGLEISGNIGMSTGQMGTNLPILNFGGGLNVQRLGMGLYQTCAYFDTGALKCWGKNQYGALGQGDTTNRGINTGDITSLPAIGF